MVSNCGINENGDVIGGRLGDNNFSEYAIVSWYNFSQRYVLRHPNLQIGIQIAQLGRDAANNNHIGYGQDYRTGFYDLVKNVGWQPSRVNQDCNADCSSSTCTVVCCVGQLTGDAACKSIAPDLSTHGMLSAYRSAGFIVLTDSRYLTSDQYLLPGDISLLPGSHTNINLDAGSLSGSDVVVSDGGVIVGSGQSVMVPAVYSPRISVPEDDDPLYINQHFSGGQNPCTAIDNKTGSVLPNCVGYCYGRFMEVMNGMKPNLPTGNANGWYSHTDEYQRGKDPKVGAIACWVNANGSGHLAVVEKIYTEGSNKDSILFSTSIYPNNKFVLQLGKAPNYLDWKDYVFKGFIYNPMAASDEAQGGDLYDEINDEDDAVLREIGYLSGHTPTTAKTNIRLSCINYTTALGAFFKGAILEPGMIITSGIAGGSVDLSGIDISSQDSVAKAIFQFFLSKGLNAAAVCGILGNMMQESSLRPWAYTADPTNTYPMQGGGLVGWTDGGIRPITNFTMMVNYVGPDWKNNLSGQLEYLYLQLHDNYNVDLNFRRNIWEPLLTVPNNSSGVVEAIRIFLVEFEMGGGSGLASIIAEEIPRRTPYGLAFWEKLAIQV